MPDLGSVDGRRICLDPGHAAGHPGATAPSNGLREDELNLRVALRVRELLQAAGATVVMTRSDGNALDPKSASNDLALRCAVASRNHADVFVSIHHNADIAPDSDKNDLEVYYKLTDDGPSLDLAQQCISALARRMRGDAPQKRLLPGNYKVLRLADMPAVLLETSYLTNSANAAFLAAPNAIEAEALAIADGLGSYFRRDPLSLAAPTLVSGVSHGRETVALPFGGKSQPVAESVRVYVDQEAREGRAWIAGNTVQWAPKTLLSNGTRVIEAYVQNTMGAWSRCEGTIDVNRPAAHLFVQQEPPIVDDSADRAFALRVHVVDEYGVPVEDGVAIKETRTGRIEHTAGGVATFYEGDPTSYEFVEAATGLSALWAVATGKAQWSTATVVDAISGRPVEGASIVAGSFVARTDTRGWVWGPRGNWTIAAEGYDAKHLRVGAEPTKVTLQPRFSGVLLGKRIMLDPAYGGRVAGSVGTDGTRASDLALVVARRMADALRAGGAEIAMTREGDIELPESERVRAENRFEPDIYVRITFGDGNDTARVVDASGHATDAGGIYAGHYPGSTNGIRLANAIADALEIDRVVPCYLYVVQQVGAPAVVVQPAQVQNGLSYTNDVAALWSMADRATDGIVTYFTRR